MAKDEFQYVSGFLNHFSVEAEKGALPQGQNNPQKPPYGLYAEQLSGTSFTSPRHLNLRTWLYRIRPSVMHTPFIRVQDSGKLRSAPFNEAAASPNQLRWDPVPFDQEEKDFSQNLITLAGSGDTVAGWGCAAHVYSISKSMEQKCFYNADGDFLIVPQVGTLKVQTEFGWMAIHPGQIGVIQRGMKFRVWVTEKSRGYVCENYGAHFRLPELGPIGANGLANPRDFLTPVAAYEDQDQDFELLCKFQGRVWKASMKHNPFDVVAWHGNYVPYVYDLKNFNVMGTVSFDHPDPSIFTVLTSPSSDPGVSNIDFVIFPDRWMVAENTFRPPYYHRNRMSEFMGLVFGKYDAKEEGFLPGGCSLHNAMSAHGPDQNSFEKATHAKLKPEYMKDSLAFMFESRYPFIPTESALALESLQKNYTSCWQGLKRNLEII